MKNDTAIVYKATIDGTGNTAGEHIEVTMEREYTNPDTGRTSPPAAFISGEPQLDTAGLRRLAAVCAEAADQLDQLTQRT